MTQDTIEKINRYLQGEMESAELRDFEQTLQNDVLMRENMEAVKSENFDVPAGHSTQNSVFDAQNEETLNASKSEQVEEQAGIGRKVGSVWTEIPADELWGQTPQSTEPPVHVPEEEVYKPKAAVLPKKTGVLLNETAPPTRSYAWVGIALFMMTIFGAGLYLLLGGTPKLFDDNMEFPADLLTDFSKRTGNGSVEEQQTPNELCQSLFKDADEKYRAGKFEDAQEPLVYMIKEENSNCQSDAYFYLAIIRLKMEDPETAVQCLAKIENFDRYGEDIQWYMALAFVQMAEKDPSMREKAKNSLERLQKSAQSPERKERVVKMLEQLE